MVNWNAKCSSTYIFLYFFYLETQSSNLFYSYQMPCSMGCRRERRNIQWWYILVSYNVLELIENGPYFQLGHQCDETKRYISKRESLCKLHGTEEFQ